MSSACPLLHRPRRRPRQPNAIATASVIAAALRWPRLQLRLLLRPLQPCGTMTKGLMCATLIGRRLRQKRDPVLRGQIVLQGVRRKNAALLRRHHLQQARRRGRPRRPRASLEWVPVVPSPRYGIPPPSAPSYGARIADSRSRTPMPSHLEQRLPRSQSPYRFARLSSRLQPRSRHPHLHQ